MCGVRQRRFPRTQSDQEPKTQTSLKKLEPERVWQQLIGYQNDFYTFITSIISQSRVKETRKTWQDSGSLGTQCLEIEMVPGTRCKPGGSELWSATDLTC